MSELARSHGKDVRAYLGGRDASGDIISITPKFSADVLDTTTMGDDWKESTPGLLASEVDVEAFYDPAAGGIARQFETLLGATGAILSIFDGDADAIGDTGILFPDGILQSRGQPMSVADMIKLVGSIKQSGRVGFAGRLLHVHGEETGTASTTAQNNDGSSASGGRGTLHVTAITGSWTIVIEQSSDNGVGDPWAALVTFTQVTAAGGVTAETKEVSGTVEQYLRVTATEDVAGSITFACGFARY